MSNTSILKPYLIYIFIIFNIQEYFFIFLAIILLTLFLGGVILINKVEIANINTSKLPKLTAQKNKELFIKMKNGDKDAREELINGNLRLVLSVIQRFGGRR